mmetsp:Transcript_71/g.319  ORF Transcript_71/g.319 Transcript_71/m.319 type:complete len:496 (-) Transcript_71:181-1668(-)
MILRLHFLPYCTAFALIALPSSSNAFNAKLATRIHCQSNIVIYPRLSVLAISKRRWLQKTTTTAYPCKARGVVVSLNESNNDDNGEQGPEDSMEGKGGDQSEGPQRNESSETGQPKKALVSSTNGSTSVIESPKAGPSEEERSREGTRFLTTYPKWSGETINGAKPTKPATILSHWRELTLLTRPANFPGICLFHMLGIYLALDRVGQLSQYKAVLLGDPTMWAVLSGLILTSSTSMVVNDYYDAKLGRDTDPSNSSLVSGSLPMYLVRRYLSYLYAATLVCAAFLPGVPARLSVILALMLTFWYTKYLKPVTWLKNVVCATLIAFSPFTSGTAALYRTNNKNLESLGTVMGIPTLWRLVAILFVGFVGREMTMDCNDVQDDAAVGVQTVPVLYGTRFASRFCFLSSTVVSLLSTAFPAVKVGRLCKTTTAASWTNLVASNARVFGRFGLALIGSSLLLRRSWQVLQTEGRNSAINDRAVDEGLVSVLFVLGSFV